MPEVQAGPCRPPIQAGAGAGLRFRDRYRGLPDVRRGFTSHESNEGPNDRLPQLQRLRPNLIRHIG